MLLDMSEEDLEVREVDESDEYMSVFFVFDSLLENSEMHSQAAVQLFKQIQSESLQ